MERKLYGELLTKALQARPWVARKRYPYLLKFCSQHTHIPSRQFTYCIVSAAIAKLENGYSNADFLKLRKTGTFYESDI